MLDPPPIPRCRSWPEREIARNSRMSHDCQTSNEESLNSWNALECLVAGRGAPLAMQPSSSQLRCERKCEWACNYYVSEMKNRLIIKGSYALTHLSLTGLAKLDEDWQMLQGTPCNSVQESHKYGTAWTAQWAIRSFSKHRRNRVQIAKKLLPTSLSQQWRRVGSLIDCLIDWLIDWWLIGWP